MKSKDATTEDLDYVIGCLFFCAETLSSLGQHELADELTALSSRLLPVLRSGAAARGQVPLH